MYYADRCVAFHCILDYTPDRRGPQRMVHCRSRFFRDVCPPLAVSDLVRPPPPCSLEHGLPQSPEFTADVITLVERQPTPHLPRLSGRAVGHPRVGVQAWTWRVPPRPDTLLPSGDNPPLPRSISTGCEWGREYLVVVRPLIEPGQALQHHTHLDVQPG